jgi:hypothetical protein
MSFVNHFTSQAPCVCYLAAVKLNTTEATPRHGLRMSMVFQFLWTNAWILPPLGHACFLRSSLRFIHKPIIQQYMLRLRHLQCHKVNHVLLLGLVYTLRGHVSVLAVTMDGELIYVDRISKLHQ